MSIFSGRTSHLITTVALITLFSCNLPAQNQVTAIATDSDWYERGAATVEAASHRAYNNTPGAAKNIILFVGDGMGVSTVSAARIFAGQQLGLDGEEYELSYEKFPWTGLSKTYTTDTQVSDSAGTATAFMTGVKTRSGVINIDSRPQRGDCAEYMNTPEATLLTALELAEVAGKATGIVSTARLTHATPAAAYANSPDRNWENDSAMPASARVNGCIDIATQLIDFEDRLKAKVNAGQNSSTIDGLEVAFGGGRENFFGADPASLDGFAEAPSEGRRNDERNLIQEWESRGGIYVMGQAGFDNLDTAGESNVLGLFEAAHMRYEANRSEDIAGEPSLTDMTIKAIEILQNDPDGFFLQVEGGRIDHAHHANSAYHALNEAKEMAAAVQAAVDMVDINETLIIVTADHSHVMTFAGYPQRGNPILGIAGRDSLGLPYTTLGYANGSGFNVSGSTDADLRSGPPSPGRKDLTLVDTTAVDYHQETLVATGGETHAGEDVAIYAIGPGAHLISGSIEQNVIFHVMNFAGDLTGKAAEALSQ